MATICGRFCVLSIEAIVDKNVTREATDRFPRQEYCQHGPKNTFLRYHHLSMSRMTIPYEVTLKNSSPSLYPFRYTRPLQVFYLRIGNALVWPPRSLSVARWVGRSARQRSSDPASEGNLPSHGTWLGTLLMTLRPTPKEREREMGLRVRLKTGQVLILRVVDR